MMQMIRSNAGKLVTIIIVGGFLAWMVYGIGMEVTGSGGRRPGELGSVNGTPISLAVYQQFDSNFDTALATASACACSSSRSGSGRRAPAG